MKPLSADGCLFASELLRHTSVLEAISSDALQCGPPSHEALAALWLLARYAATLQAELAERDDDPLEHALARLGDQERPWCCVEHAPAS